MEIFDKLRAIREVRGIERKDLAARMGCDVSLIGKIERGEARLSDEMLRDIRKVCNIVDVPLTDNELRRFEEDLGDWEELLKERDFEEARRLQPVFDERANLSLNVNARILYNLYATEYFSMTGDFAGLDACLDWLSGYLGEFNKEQRFRYLMSKGASEHSKGRYFSALKHLLEAEQVNKRLRVSCGGLYYTIAQCYTSVDCSNNAVEYITKARQAAGGTDWKTLEIYLDVLLALNYMKLERSGDALTLLSDCLHRERSSGGFGLSLGSIYHNLGCVYAKLMDYDRAVEFFDEAFAYFVENSASYVNNMLHKTYALRESERNDECADCLERGLIASEPYDSLNMLFNAFRCVLTIEEPSSRVYIEKTAIPKLLEAGRFLKVIEYCDLLKEYYKCASQYKAALKYSEMSFKYHQKINKGVLVL